MVHSTIKIDNQHWLRISTSQQGCNMSTVYPEHHHQSFSSWSGILAHWTQQCERICFRWSMAWKSWQYKFYCEALQSTILTRLRSTLLSGKFLCFHQLWYMGKQVISEQCHFTALVQRISNCGEVQNTNSYSHKKLNVLVYGSLSSKFSTIGEPVNWPLRCERQITGESLFLL